MKEEFQLHILRDTQMYAASLHKRILGREEDFDSRKLDERTIVYYKIHNQYIYNYLTDEPIKSSIVEVMVKKRRKLNWQSY